MLALMRMKYNITKMNLGIVPLVLLLSGCAWFMPQRESAPDQGLHDSLVRDRIKYEAEAAVGRPGAFVCRKVAVGISEIDWMRGTVMSVKGERVEVKISDPGKYPHEMNGVEVAEGALLWDEETNWMACLK